MPLGGSETLQMARRATVTEGVTWGAASAMLMA